MALAQAKLGLKDATTLASVAAGVASIGLSLKQEVALAAALVLVAAFLDYADGAIARAGKRSNEFGRQLDSLADAIAFAAAPAALALGVENNLLVLAAAIAYAGAGVFRLARFNLQKEKGVYYGLPIPAAALAVVVMVLFAPAFLSGALLVLAGAMVSAIKFRKV